MTLRKCFNPFGCGESIKEFLALGFRGSVLGVFDFCDLKRPHKPRLQNRCLYRCKNRCYL